MMDNYTYIHSLLRFSITTTAAARFPVGAKSGRGRVTASMALLVAALSSPSPELPFRCGRALALSYREGTSGSAAGPEGGFGGLKRITFDLKTLS